MSEYRPYDSYEPNEPVSAYSDTGAKKPLAPAQPLTGARQQTARRSTDRPEPTMDTWDSEDRREHLTTQNKWDEYTPNEAPRAAAGLGTAAARNVAEPAQTARGARRENPYARPTWDETAYVPDQDVEAPTDSQSYDADTDSLAPDTPEDTLPNRYVRPSADAPDGVSDLSARFAPPLRFEMPKSTHAEPREQWNAYAREEPNVYQTRKPAAYRGDGMGFDPTPRSNEYSVEEENAYARRLKSRRRARRWIIALLIIAVLGAAAYLKRDWVLEKLKPLLGEAAVESVNLAVNEAVGIAKTPVTGYDPAPAIQINDQAKKGIHAVAGSLDLETYAVTANNIVARVETSANQYDFYLFSAKNGQLLGYYEGLAADGLTVCQNDIFYITQSPYLINDEGLPLINASQYQQSVGADAVLGPMINGWAILSDAKQTTFNLINAKGELLSKLWFAKVYPFTGNATIAYVDTGNVADAAQRYTLYEIDRQGEMKLWRHAADMNDVFGCACGVAVMKTGELILLDGKQTTLCTTDEASAYVDCGAMVVRDTQTGKYGLYVNGEQHYGFEYDSIAPVMSDIRWDSTNNGFYRQYTASGITYPLPLSHYFTLKKGESQEMVALSTASVYPLLLNVTK